MDLSSLTLLLSHGKGVRLRAAPPPQSIRVGREEEERRKRRRRRVVYPSQGPTALQLFLL